MLNDYFGLIFRPYFHFPHKDSPSVSALVHRKYYLVHIAVQKSYSVVLCKTAVLQYCSTSVLQYISTAVLLYCCRTEVVKCKTAGEKVHLEAGGKTPGG